MPEENQGWIEKKKRRIRAKPLKYAFIIAIPFLCIASVLSIVSHYELDGIILQAIDYIVKKITESESYKLVFEFLILTATFILIFIWFYKWVCKKSNRIKITVEVFGVAAAIAGLYAIYYTLNITKIQIQEERFAKAYEQTGNKNVAVRLGGLSLLEILSHESKKYCIRVWTFLDQFILYRPELDEYLSLERGYKPLESGKEKEKLYLLERVSDEKVQISLIPERPDIDKIVKMQKDNKICNHLEIEKIKIVAVDNLQEFLSQSRLIDADLRSLDLSSIKLSNSDLSGSDLRKANLSNADLPKATLTDANLAGANLTDANLAGANLTDANLSSIAVFSEASISIDTNVLSFFSARPASLYSKIEESTTITNLSNANLSKAELVRSNLFFVNLSNVDLMDSDLTNANLTGTDLTAANLMYSNLKGVNLFTARSLLGTNIYKTENLSKEDKKEALRRGAVSMQPEEWEKFRIYAEKPAFKAIYKRIVDAGKSWNDPIFVDAFKEAVSNEEDLFVFLEHFMEEHKIEN